MLVEKREKGKTMIVKHESDGLPTQRKWEQSDMAERKGSTREEVRAVRGGG
jgi:hypothetical protein